MPAPRPSSRRPAASALAARLAVAALALALAACGSDDQSSIAGAPLKGTYVARVQGSRAYLALITDGKRLTGYLCDGKQLSRWLKTTAIEHGEAKLTTRTGQTLGTATLAAEQLRVRLELGRKPRPFEAAPARGPAGLYRAAVERAGRLRAEAGWIVLADGSQRRATNQFIDPLDDFNTEPAPRLDPARPTVTIADGTSNTRVTANKLATGFIERGIDL